MSWSIKNKLKEILAKEVGTQIFPKGLRHPVAFLYPNTYNLGMSNLGLHILYQMINKREDSACERFFLPDKATVQEHIKSKTPLLSLETQTVLADFPVICVMMSFEMDYTNFLKLLKLGHIKFDAKARGNKDPLVVMGGPCATFNPEPLAEFVDVFVIGEGEETLNNILDVIYDCDSKGLNREEKLLALANTAGVYVPKFYDASYDEAGDFVSLKANAKVPATIKRQWVKDLDAHPHASAIITTETEFESMYIVEVARGCGRHCRFCMAGYCFRKPRNRKLEAILKDIENRPETTKKVGLMGAAISDYPQIKELTRELLEKEVPFTVASLRADTLDQELSDALAKSGQRTMTIAPEAGSERMRAAINKGITEEHVYNAIEYAAKSSMRNIKLYYMIGLPGEEDEDIEAMAEMIVKVRAKMDTEGNKGELVISVNAFVPKPFTPYQWEPLCNVKVLKKRLKILSDKLKKEKRIVFNAESLKETVIQAVLARGERRIAPILAKAVLEDMSIKDAWDNSKCSLQEYAERELDQDKMLPWGHLDVGVTEKYLKTELMKSQKGEFSPMCQDGCNRCGVCS